MPETAERVTNPPLTKVRGLITLGRCEEALFELSVTVRQFPTWAEPWALVAQALSLRCRYDDALSAADEALMREPGHLWAQELRTGLLLQLRQPTEALASAERLVAMSPDRAESHAFLAFAQSFVGNDRQALHAARRSRKLAPHSALGHQALCVVHLASRKWDSAERHASAALEIAPNTASVLHDLAIAQFEQGKFDQAHHAMRRAARLDERYQSALAKLGKRTPSGAPPIPVLLALAAGIAAIPFGRMPVVFVIVVLIGIGSLVLAARQTGSARTLHPDRIRPALVIVLCVDIFVALQQLGVLG